MKIALTKNKYGASDGSKKLTNKSCSLLNQQNEFAASTNTN
jgi:hypothetical protein